MRHWWDILEKGKVGVTFSGLKSELGKIPRTSNIRFWDAGDCPGDGTLMDKTSCVGIADALKNRDGRQFGYTHYDMDIYHNRNVVRMMLRRGTVVNSSTLMNNVDKIAAYNIPVVVNIPEPMTTTPNGMAIVVCPNQLAKENNATPIQCNSCMLCAKWPRNFAIGFLPHGTNKFKVKAISAAACITATGDTNAEISRTTFKFNSTS